MPTEPTATPPDKTLEELLNEPNVKFRIVFQGSPQTRTTSVSSANLKPSSGTMSSVTLSSVRDIGNLPKAYLFCIDDSNTVADTTGLGEYFSSTKDNITALQKADAGTSAILTVQYTSRHRPPAKIPDPPKLTGAPDDVGKLPEIDHKSPVAVGIATTGLVAGSDTITSTHPAEMTDKEWNYVMITNSLLHGMFLDTTSYTFQKARYPAFKLKASFPDPFHSSAGSTDPGKDDKVYIPAFEVSDESSVTITEVKTTYELSKAQHAFNSSSVEASASGGMGSISGGGSASASWSSSNSSASKLSKTMDVLHASYNFPRVKVFLDSDDLEMTEDCRMLLDVIFNDRKQDDVARFYRKYGHIFASSVQLGGRLHTTKESTSSNETKYKEEKVALKVAAAASLSSSFASGSVSASHGSNNESNSSQGSGKGSDSLAWEAQGGETLLATNPPAWIVTVGPFNNWRVIERSNVHDILTLLKHISGQDWPVIFSEIERLNAGRRDPLFLFSPPKEDGMIKLNNDTDKKFRIAISTEDSEQSAEFIEMDSETSSTWMRNGNECVFINQVDSNRVTIAMAHPGVYSIEKLDSNDSSCFYTQNSLQSIGVVNNTGNIIQVKVGTLNSEAAKFRVIYPGMTEHWQQNTYEIIFIKHLTSITLFTYLGVSGRDLQVGIPSGPPSPDFKFVNSSRVVVGTPTGTNPISAIALNVSTEMSVFNAQSNVINVKVSSTALEEGREGFVTAEHRMLKSWTRKGDAVIYVNGLGTAVWAYFGMLGLTLIADQEISK